MRRCCLWFLYSQGAAYGTLADLQLRSLVLVALLPHISPKQCPSACSDFAVKAGIPARLPLLNGTVCRPGRARYLQRSEVLRDIEVRFGWEGRHLIVASGMLRTGCSRWCQSACEAVGTKCQPREPASRRVDDCCGWPARELRGPGYGIVFP